MNELKSKKKKKYLITNFQKLNFPKGSQINFIDEYLYNSYLEKKKLNINYSYIFNSNEINKLEPLVDGILKKKLIIYRKQLKNFLNLYHNLNNNYKYWGLIIDQFLIILLRSIIFEIKLIKKIKLKEYYNIYYKTKAQVIDNSESFLDYSRSNNFNKLLSSLIFKVLKKKSVKIIFEKFNKKKRKNENFFKLILKYLTRKYITIFHPTLIIDGYMGLKNTIIFFIKSFGKVINLPRSYLFNENCYNRTLDFEFRKKIKILERDLVDKIFNKIIGIFLPMNFLENFKFIKEDVKKISKEISVLGTGNSHYYNDNFKILASEILKKKNGKLLIFQHGGSISKTNKIRIEYLDQKYATKKYYFDNPDGLGFHFFNQKKISLDQIKRRDKILIIDTEKEFRKIDRRRSAFVNIDPNLNFFLNLDDDIKKKILLKLFPSKKSYDIKKFWKKKFKTKINFLPIFLNAKKNNFFNAKLVILNDVQTPMWELLYAEIPFIIIGDKCLMDSWQYKDSFKKKFFMLKKINILFDDPRTAANFINLLFKKNKFEDWWKKTKSSEILQEFKKYLIIERPNYHSKLIKQLKYLNK